MTVARVGGGRFYGSGSVVVVATTLIESATLSRCHSCSHHHPQYRFHTAIHDADAVRIDILNIVWIHVAILDTDSVNTTILDADPVCT
jgi:hypothetical protein